MCEPALQTKGASRVVLGDGEVAPLHRLLKPEEQPQEFPLEGEKDSSGVLSASGTI